MSKRPVYSIGSQWEIELGMFDLALVFQLINNCFDQGVFAQQDFIVEAHNMAIHIFTKLGKELNVVGKQANRQTGKQTKLSTGSLCPQIVCKKISNR